MTEDVSILTDGHLTKQQIPNETLLKEINELQDFLNSNLTQEEKKFLTKTFENKYFYQITDLSKEELEFIKQHGMLRVKYSIMLLLTAILTCNIKKDSSGIKDAALFELGQYASIIRLGEIEKIRELIQFQVRYYQNRARGGREKGKNHKEASQRIEKKVTELYQKNNSLTLADVLAFFQAHDLFQNKMVENSLVKIIQKQLKKLNENTSKQTDNLE